MGRLTVEGIVPKSFTNQGEFYLKVCDYDQAKAAAFFRGTDTVLRNNSIGVRNKEFVQKCKAGDLVRLTLEHHHRKDGIRVRAIGCELIES
jgi:hypothetical protein